MAVQVQKPKDKFLIIKISETSAIDNTRKEIFKYNFFLQSNFVN